MSDSGISQFGENMDENAMQQAMKQKTLSQQASAQTGPLQSSSTPTADPQQSGQTSDSFVDTILTNPIEDISTTIVTALGLEKLLGLTGKDDTPEEKVKKQKTLQRYNQLNEEQQAVARANYQERLQRQKQAEQEAEQKRQIEAQKNQDVVVPTGKSDGATEGGSGKQRAVTKLQNDRKTLGGPQSAG